MKGFLVCQSRAAAVDGSVISVRGKGKGKEEGRKQDKKKGRKERKKEGRKERRNEGR